MQNTDFPGHMPNVDTVVREHDTKIAYDANSHLIEQKKVASSISS